MKISIFWDVTCSPLKVNRRFGGTFRLHFQQATSACYLLQAGLLLVLFFVPEDEGDMFIQNVG
jgi:hypothetical protein